MTDNQNRKKKSKKSKKSSRKSSESSDSSDDKKKKKKRKSKHRKYSSSSSSSSDSSGKFVYLIYFGAVLFVPCDFSNFVLFLDESSSDEDCNSPQLLYHADSPNVSLFYCCHK